MILVDTSVWIDHFRHANEGLEKLLNDQQVLIHPFVIGELALGHLKQRDTILGALQDLPSVKLACHAETLGFIHQHALFGLGIGYIDAHLLAAVRLTPDTYLWTYDKRLLSAARRLSLAAHWADMRFH